MTQEAIRDKMRTLDYDCARSVIFSQRGENGLTDRNITYVVQECIEKYRDNMLELVASMSEGQRVYPSEIRSLKSK